MQPGRNQFRYYDIHFNLWVLQGIQNTQIIQEVFVIYWITSTSTKNCWRLCGWRHSQMKQSSVDMSPYLVEGFRQTICLYSLISLGDELSKNISLWSLWSSMKVSVLDDLQNGWIDLVTIVAKYYITQELLKHGSWKRTILQFYIRQETLL